ncbi:MAG: hypothetical protein DMG07_04905 [Acidobacteria bacterium]|nr:MAG: hypothetical protein DMG07_04905 [Acidobacteriota bacterium]
MVDARSRSRRDAHRARRGAPVLAHDPRPGCPAPSVKGRSADREARRGADLRQPPDAPSGGAGAGKRARGDARLGLPASRVRTLAGVGLCRLGEPSGESVLLEAVRSPEPKLRRAGVWGLGMAARHDFEPILERLAADDPDLEVRLLAGQVLRGAGGRPRLDTT